MAEPTPVPRGILLVGHGTRDASGREEFLEVARQMAELRPEQRVEPCFLELAEPPIAEGLGRLAAAGNFDITVTPLLLFAAGHAKSDIPDAVAEAAKAWPAMRLSQTEPLDCHPKILELSQLRADEALVGRKSIPAEQTVLVLVGRGSSDPEATAALGRFAELRLMTRPAARVVTCFLAVARPTVDECLAELVTLAPRRVIVQPHLLFQGELLVRLRRRMEQFAREHPAIDCVLTSHLGPHPLLAGALCGEGSR